MADRQNPHAATSPIPTRCPNEGCATILESFANDETLRFCPTCKEVHAFMAPEFKCCAGGSDEC